MEPDDLLCSRNARPQMDAKEQADCSSCSQSPHDKAVVARCAQGRTICLLPLGKLGNQKALVGRAQWGTSQPTPQETIKNKTRSVSAVLPHPARRRPMP